MSERHRSRRRTRPAGSGAPERSPRRVAVISIHTSPRDQPGTGDSGGMNVYIAEVARRLSEQGIEVDIFTRRDADRPVLQQLDPRTRLIHVPAGPAAPVPKELLPRFLRQFADGVVTHAAEPAPHEHAPYDVVHSHYWLSGWVGNAAKEIWGVPHVASFHTLGRVKNGSLADGDRPEPAVRLAGEQRVVSRADRIVAPTTVEADDLVSLYGADRRRIAVVSPGVDRAIFRPGRRDEAKARLSLPGARLLLFVGRLQPFKGPDVAIRALARAVTIDPALTRDVVLAVVGGPAGTAPAGDEIGRLMEIAARSGVADRVIFLPPQPHERLADLYAAAEAVLVPSRSESFGLVALEAQACGTPVIASRVGGLRQVVVDGRTGVLLDGHDPSSYAAALIRILSDPSLAAAMGRAAVEHAARFSWDRTVTEVRRVYDEVLTERESTDRDRARAS